MHANAKPNLNNMAEVVDNKLEEDVGKETRIPLNHKALVEDVVEVSEVEDPTDVH